MIPSLSAQDPFVHFSVFETATGRVVRGGYMTSEEAALSQALDGESVYLGDVPAGHYMLDGAPAPMGERPSPNHTFDYEAKVWRPPAGEALQALIVERAQQRLDEFARTRGYDGILSAATYATSTVERFAAEGQRAVDARDATWTRLYQLLDEVQKGVRPIPASYEDIESELPTLTWSAST